MARSIPRGKPPTLSDIPYYTLIDEHAYVVANGLREGSIALPKKYHVKNAKDDAAGLMHYPTGIPHAKPWTPVVSGRIIAELLTGRVLPTLNVDVVEFYGGDYQLRPTDYTTARIMQAIILFADGHIPALLPPGETIAGHRMLVSGAVWQHQLNRTWNDVRVRLIHLP